MPESFFLYSLSFIRGKFIPFDHNCEVQDLGVLIRLVQVKTIPDQKR